MRNGRLYWGRGPGGGFVDRGKLDSAKFADDTDMQIPRFDMVTQHHRDGKLVHLLNFNDYDKQVYLTS